MRNQGLGSWPARRARMTPDWTAVLAGRRSFSYQALAERVDRLANALCGLGVAHGDRVCYLGPNDPAFLETLFARGALGAIFVPLNFRLSGPELEFIVADAGATVLVDAAGCGCREPHPTRVTCSDADLFVGDGCLPAVPHDGRSCACDSSTSSSSTRSRGCGWPAGRARGRTPRSCCCAISSQTMIIPGFGWRANMGRKTPQNNNWAFMITP
jgi:hypothetical protein